MLHLLRNDFVAVEIIIFTLRHYIYKDNMCLKKLIPVIRKPRMLKKLAHEVILLTFSWMKPVYFVFIKFNSHLLQIRKVVGWELSAK